MEGTENWGRMLHLLQGVSTSVLCGAPDIPGLELHGSSSVQQSEARNCRGRLNW